MKAATARRGVRLVPHRPRRQRHTVQLPTVLVSRASLDGIEACNGDRPKPSRPRAGGVELFNHVAAASRLQGEGCGAGDVLHDNVARAVLVRRGRVRPCRRRVMRLSWRRVVLSCGLPSTGTVQARAVVETVTARENIISRGPVPTRNPGTPALTPMPDLLRLNRNGPAFTLLRT